MKPHIHAENSVAKFGGSVADYIKIHNWFDQTKAFMADNRHRALLHSSFGIFLCTQVFGELITNSDGKQVSVRDIGEQHVLEDYRGKFIPSVQDWLGSIRLEPWMNNGDGLPPSLKSNVPSPVPLNLEDICVDGPRSIKNTLVPPVNKDVFYDGLSVAALNTPISD